jgi:hypothetical protein
VDCSKIPSVTSSVFIHPLFAFCRRSPQLVLRLYYVLHFRMSVDLSRAGLWPDLSIQTRFSLPFWSDFPQAEFWPGSIWRTMDSENRSALATHFSTKMCNSNQILARGSEPICLGRTILHSKNSISCLVLKPTHPSSKSEPGYAGHPRPSSYTAHIGPAA